MEPESRLMSEAESHEYSVGLERGRAKWLGMEYAPKEFGVEVIAVDGNGRVRRVTWWQPSFRTQFWRNVEDNKPFDAVWWIPCPPLDLPKSPEST